MSERPIILFPSPERADRGKLGGGGSQDLHTPQITRQYDRLHPAFKTLQEAFRQKHLRLQQTTAGIDPEYALVVETAGSVDSFYTAVKNVAGLEWIFDTDSEGVEPDEDFYKEEHGVKKEDRLNGKIYCLMTNQQALEQMLSLWQRYATGEKSDDLFPTGLTGLRDVFTHIINIRQWDAADRLADTGILEVWNENLQTAETTPAPFEIELFYRANPEKRESASKTVRTAIAELEGKVIHECVVSEIAYHAILAELPRNIIGKLVDDYESIKLVHVDDVMFFRPRCQSTHISALDTEQLDDMQAEWPAADDTIIAAVLDGMPMQNHPLLKDRITIDDPDGYDSDCESKYRIHGTAMASLAVYGDLNKKAAPVKHKIYVRPIFKPKLRLDGSADECIPEDVLVVDMLNRSVIRIKEGENSGTPTAPEVQIVNLSLGDPHLQLDNSMSPLARLVDYLAYKYRLLFIISAGNHAEILETIKSSLEDLRAQAMPQRHEVFWSALKENQRSLRLLSPAESLNGLTVGATYDDFSDVKETDRLILAVDKGMPSPISALGKGYRGMMSPDILYSGGRKFIHQHYGQPLKWLQNNSRAPGCKVAAPFKGGIDFGQAYSYGTSDAAAQVTHEAINCHDILTQIFREEGAAGMPRGYEAIMLKAMLTHGASWESFAEELSRVTGDKVKQLSKWAGNGVADIDKVKECTRERITLIGYGELKIGQAHVFRLPLHLDFSSRQLKRKLTVTLAYLSPIIASRQAYRAVRMWFDVGDGGKKLFPEGSRQNSEWQAVRKGTLQHEIFTGESPIVWNDDDLAIRVNCKEDAWKFKSETYPYCIFVSFEVAEGLGIDLYTTVKNQIRQQVRVQ